MPGGTPYVTAGMLTSMPASIAWNVIPTLTASSTAQLAQLAQECWKATSAVERYCHQPLRAVVNTQQETGPGMGRLAVDRVTGVATLITRRTPVTQVLAVQYAAAPPYGIYPPAWAAVPTGQWNIRHPPVMSAGPAASATPDGGNTIDATPGYIDWRYGRGGWNTLWTYVHAWPHTSLTQDAAAGTDTVDVDDVTGWGGVTGWVYDSTSTEAAEVTTAAATTPVTLPGAGGTAQAGPGTLTLSGTLQFAHQAGTVISALPADVIRAAALQAAVQALEGIDAIATQSLSGQMAGGTGALAGEVQAILCPYRVVA